MPISWNEIRSRVMAFAHEWGEEASEAAESQTFWNDFFNVFGLSRYRVAAFEKRARNIEHQAIMDKNARRNLGAHYTSEKNILKLIKPLFMDELRSEFEKSKHS